MSINTLSADILIVGAGMAGLTAAAHMHNKGYQVLIVEKSRGVGGRLASRRIGQATFDHGAQFMTVRDTRFASAVAQWQQIGVVQEWFTSALPGNKAHVRWCGYPSMSAVAKHLAKGASVTFEQRVVSLKQRDNDWLVSMASGEMINAKALLLTPPVPQTLAIITASSIVLTAGTKKRLSSLTYDRCIAVLAVLDGPSAIPLPGCIAPSQNPISWMADNQQKGISKVPAVTIHADASFSYEHWDLDRRKSGNILLSSAQPWLSSKVIDFQVHAWKYAKPQQIHKDPCLIISQSPPCILAGDAFAGPRVEGAARSGWAAAKALEKLIRNHRCGS